MSRLYLLVRNDLPSMNPGKAIAQAAHAANQFTYRHGKERSVKEWMDESKEGFGTTITLSVTKEQLSRIFTRAISLELFAGMVTDITYPYIVNSEIARLIDKNIHTDLPVPKDGQWLCFRREVTCGFVFIDNSDPSQSELVSDLPLHP